MQGSGEHLELALLIFNINLHQNEPWAKVLCTNKRDFMKNKSLFIKDGTKKRKLIFFTIKWSCLDPNLKWKAANNSWRTKIVTFSIHFITLAMKIVPLLNLFQLFLHFFLKDSKSFNFGKICSWQNTRHSLVSKNYLAFTNLCLEIHDNFFRLKDTNLIALLTSFYNIFIVSYNVSNVEL